MNNYDLQKTNYDNSEYVFSWDKNDPLIVPDIMICKNCNAKIKKYGPRCDGVKCGTCGYSVREHGFPEMMYRENVDPRAPNHRLAGGLEKHSVNSNDPQRLEHMNTDIVTGSCASGCGSWLYMVLVACLIANWRCDIKSGGVESNFGVYLCLFICPHMYITYVLVDIVMNGWSKC